MAIITFDSNNNRVSILVEKTDVIHKKEGSVTHIYGANTQSIGHIFVNGNIDLCMIRGER